MSTSPFTNQFLISVTIDQLGQIDQLYQKLVALKQLAEQPSQPMRLPTEAASAQLEKLQNELNQTRAELEKLKKNASSPGSSGTEKTLKNIEDQAEKTNAELGKTISLAQQLVDVMRGSPRPSPGQGYGARMIAGMTLLGRAKGGSLPLGKNPSPPLYVAPAGPAASNANALLQALGRTAPINLPAGATAATALLGGIPGGVTGGGPPIRPGPMYAAPIGPPPPPPPNFRQYAAPIGPQPQPTQYGNAFHQFSYKFKQLAYYATAGSIIFGLAQGIRSTVTELVRFDAELAKIQGFFDDRSLDSRLLIQRGTIQAAKDYGVALSEVVRVTKFFAQAGFNPTESVAQTRAALSAASALDIEPQAAAQTAIAVREITDERVSSRDIFERLSKIDAQFAVNASDLNAAVQRVGAFVSQLQPRSQGVVDALDLVIGTTTQIVQTTRVTGNQAANALKFIVARLAAPEVANSLQTKFGIRLAANAEGTQFRPLYEILEEIATTYKALKTPGPDGTSRSVEAAQLLTTIAGSRQVGLATALFDEFNKALEIARESSMAYGTLQARLNLQLDTVMKRMQQFGTAFLSFANTFAEQTGIFNAVKAIFQGGTKLLNFAEKDTGGAVGTTFAGLIAANLGIQAFKGVGRAVTAYRASTAKGAYPFTTGQLLKEMAGAFINVGAFKDLRTKMRGMNNMQRLFSAVGAVFGSLTPIAIIAGLVALGALVKWLIDNKDNKLRVRRTTFEDIDRTDFGKELTEKTGALGITNRQLSERLLRARDLARTELIGYGQAESLKPAGLRNPEIEKFADAAYTDSVLTDKVKNRFFRPLFENLLTQAFLNQFDSETVAKVTGAELRSGPTNEQVSYVQNLIRLGAQYESAPDIATAAEQNKKLTDYLTKIKPEEVVKTFLETRPTTADKIVPGLDGSFVTTYRPTTVNDALRQAFGKLAPNFQLFMTQVDNAGKSVNAFDQAMQEVNAKSGNFAAGLDEFFRKFYTTEGGLERPVVEKNRELLRQGFVESLKIASPEIAAAYGTTPEQLKERPGEFAGQIILQELRAAIEILRQNQSVRTSKSGQQLLVMARVMEQLGPGFVAKLQRDLEIIATVRDRIGEEISKFAAKMLEITKVTPVLRNAGFAIDDVEERLGAAESFLRSFSAIPAQIEGERMGLRLKESQLEALIRPGASIVDLGARLREFREQNAAEATDIPDESSLDSGTTVNLLTQGERALERVREQIRQYSGLLREFVNNKELITYARPEEIQAIRDALLASEDGSFSFKNADEIEATVTRVVDRLFDASIAQKLFNLQLEKTYDIMQRQLTLQSDLAEIREREYEADVRRSGRIAVGPQLLSFDRQRQDAIRKAQIERERREARANAALGRTLNRAQFAAEMQEAADAFQAAVEEANNTATINMASLLSTERTRILDDTAQRIREVIEEATSGLRSTLKDTKLLFAQGKDIKFVDTVQSIIGPAGAAIQNNLVDNLMELLGGPGGLFEGQLTAFFGQTEKQRERLQLQQMQMDATYQGTLRGVSEAFEKYGFTPSQPPVPGLPGKESMANPLASFRPGSRLGLAFDFTRGMLPLFSAIAAGGGALTGSSYASAPEGVPGILQGAFSPTGPNAGSILSLEALQMSRAGKEKMKAFQRAAAKKMAAQLAGIYGGTLLGQAIGKGQYSFAAEGSQLGSALGGLIPGLGPLGAIGGGLLGGLVGGLFGKSKPPKPPRKPEVLELIERNTRQTAEAVENQNRQLFTLDSRLFNAPASFALQKYRPQGVDSAVAGPTFNNVFNISGADPQAIAAEIEKVMSSQQRLRGGFVSIRPGV